MGYAALKLKSQAIFRVIEGGKKTAAPKSFNKPTTHVLILGVILAILQILDGILTGIGMHTFGTAAEGNLLLRYLMESWGFIPTLFLTKSIALGVIAMLCLLSNRVSWLPYAMHGVIAIYLFAAILPWSYLLYRYI